MPKLDPEVMLLCPMPVELLDALDAEAESAGLDRAGMLCALLTEVLSDRVLGCPIDEALRPAEPSAEIIAFPRPRWAVDPEAID